METLHITRNEIDEQGRYIGEFLVGSWAGNIEIEAGLGYVRFAGRVSAAGCIIAKAGSGIKAGYIEAGLGIKAGGGIEAGFRIFAGICTWRIPTDAERAITCARLIAGEVAYGTLVETAAKGSE